MLETLQSANDPVLISFAICPFVQRSAILLHWKKQPFTRINIDLQNKPDWFLRLSATGKVPLLYLPQDGKDAEVLFESAVINEYLDETLGHRLLAESPLSRARERAQISYSESLLMQQYQLLLATEEKDFEPLSQSFLNNLAKLAGQPTSSENGSDLSLFDASIAPLFTRLQLTPSLYDRFKQMMIQQPQLITWIESLCELEAVKKSVEADFEQQFVDYFSARGSYALSKELQAA